MEEKYTIGGQAVMEGVMMKSPHYLNTSVRKKDGEIKDKSREYYSLKKKSRLFEKPFIRGIIVLFEMLIIGVKELNYSAKEAAEDEDIQLGFWELTTTVVLAVAGALLIFKLLPLFIAETLSKTSNSNLLLNALDGGAKIVLFTAYLLLISQMKDVKRLFQYHGAEHKAINCYEAGEELTPENVEKYPTKQVRCGTTFIIFVFLLSVLFYLAIPLNYNFWLKYGLRVLLLPIIAGVTYEIIRGANKVYHKSKIVRALVEPGLWFQKLTIRKPSREQIEVAISSLKTVLKREEEKKRD